MLGVLVIALAILGAAPLGALAQGDHDHDRDRDRDGRRVTVHFGDGGFGFGFGFGHTSDWRDRDRHGWGVYTEHDRWRGYSTPVRAGHYEYQTETYIVTPGYWAQTFVHDRYSGHYENVWVPPVYGRRTVTVWVQR